VLLSKRGGVRNNDMKILNKKFLNFVTLDRILGGMFMYLIVFSIVWSVDLYASNKEKAEARALEYAQQQIILNKIAKPASDYLEYLSIEPVKPMFDSFEDIEMRSITIRKASAFIHWNDILYCDANEDGTFAFIYSSETSRYNNVKGDPIESNVTWFFVEPTARLPRVPSAPCYILSQQEICPPVLVNVEGASCKYQEKKSGTFTLINRNKI